ncbi:PREDICTED: uncharacterized protein LOC105151580 [Acromyrmex echinatior]|uniref:uncharacterized protein LOC105151580 n=1 Tax=Acromyrmex echinatior TaxID=103372 RepID=UPI00058105C1|nr:PREDICTED: uncharacterized protein LOC105151580 [Acromyrmex echinatior]
MESLKYDRAIIPILNMIMKDWKKIKNDQERNLMIRRAQTARIIITCSYCIIALQWTFISVLPIFGVTMRLTSNITDPGRMLMPLQSHYIYDITKSPQYELTFISQAVYLVIAMMTYSGVDNFLSLVVFHICGQLDILANRMQHLDKYKNYPQVLKCCIEKHIHLLRFVTCKKTYMYNIWRRVSGGTRFTQIIREKDEDRLRCRRASLLYGLPVDSLEVDLTQENWRLRAGFRQAVYSR